MHTFIQYNILIYRKRFYVASCWFPTSHKWISSCWVAMVAMIQGFQHLWCSNLICLGVYFQYAQLKNRDGRFWLNKIRFLKLFFNWCLVKSNFRIYCFLCGSWLSNVYNIHSFEMVFSSAVEFHEMRWNLYSDWNWNVLYALNSLPCFDLFNQFNKLW